MFADKKITKATFKSFVKKNGAKLFVKVSGQFDCQIDGMSSNRAASFQPAIPAGNAEYTLGFEGIRLVGGSRNYFYAFEDENYVGIRLSNCVVCMTVAILKSKAAA